ncbi:MAG: MerR family DNA-binding transcriptional regulator, partial [Firmicutes bacterium]|nr:MerR family DNA-binding transcriptional regulator [Bacillota bacterium]
MKTYTTSQIAKIIGIHPNTVRMYEEWGLIPLAERKSNGYRIFTVFHIQQLRLARTAFQIEVLQNGLRKKAVDTVKLSAKGNFDKALMFAE